MGTRLYPATKDPKVLCYLAGVSEETWDKMKELEEEIEKRSNEFGCYIPLPDEYELGEEEDGGRKIEVMMPDGVIMEGNTAGQGESHKDASYLVYKWKIDYYPEVEKLESFLTYGWGRVRFPRHWKNRVYRDSRDFIGPMIGGEYYMGGINYKDFPADSLIEDLVWNTAYVHTDRKTIEGVYWV